MRHAGTGPPTLDCYLFEFVERQRWDDGSPQFLTLSNYYINLPLYDVLAGEAMRR